MESATPGRIVRSAGRRSDPVIETDPGLAQPRALVDVSEVIGLLDLVADAVSDGVVILDAADRVIGFNQAFADLTGYSRQEAPFEPPYPWWPTEEENATARDQLAEALRETGSGNELDQDLLIYRRDRRPLVVQSRGAGLRDREGTTVARLRVVRDLTKDRAARQHRLDATRASAAFATAADLETLLEAAEDSFNCIFDGVSTISVRVGAEQVSYSEGRFLESGTRPAAVTAAFKAGTSADTLSRRSGILLLPRLPGESQAKTWVQFPRPRRIAPDELIVADLLAQDLTNAVQRIADAERAAGREAQLKEAVDSHRAVGQAVGVLVERHRVLPDEALARIRKSSQDKNVRMRELAERIMQTGEDPEAV